MASVQSRLVTKQLINVIKSKFQGPNFASQRQSSPILTRDFSIPAGEGFKFNGREAYEPEGDQTPPSNPIPNRPLRDDRRPHSRSPRDPRSPNTAANDSSLQSLKSALASGSRRKEDDSESDKKFLERFKLGFENKERKQSVSDPDGHISVPQEKDKVAEPENSDEIFKKMKETGLIPNAVAMLDGLCKDGLVQEAMKLFTSMREKGTMPEVIVYTAVVDGFCRAHKLDDAKRIFRKMQELGITPNAFSYNVLIQGLCKCNFLDDAVEICVEMLEAGHSPNVSSFVGLVDVFSKEKGVEEAKTVITTLTQKGFFLNEKAVRAFLDKKASFSAPVWEAIFGKKPRSSRVI